jgi:hypothetical protein
MAARRTAKQAAASRANLVKARRSRASSAEHPMVSHDAPGTTRKRVASAKALTGKKIRKPLMSDFKVNLRSSVHPEDQWEAHRRKVAKAHGYE